MQGNVGDSRAVASCSGVAEPLSFDHKPANEEEAKRIIAAGGWVEFNRVNGNLALSRALGDFIFKRNDEKRPEEQIVTGELIKYLESAFRRMFPIVASAGNDLCRRDF